MPLDNVARIPAAAPEMSASASRTWTPSRTARLRFLWADGQSASQIAADLHITRNAVLGKATRLGLSERGSPIIRKPPPEHPTLLELTNKRCCYPLGERFEPAKFFCGCDVARPGLPYCSSHMEIAWDKPRTDSYRKRAAVTVLAVPVPLTDAQCRAGTRRGRHG